MKKMKVHIGFILILLFLFPVVNTRSQGSVPSAESSPETLSVFFDKPFYVTGENIWFSVYIHSGAIKETSRVLHFRIINPEGISLYESRLPVYDGMASGNMEIPYEWPEGYYTFQAITRWNLNFRNGDVFEQVIPFYNVNSQQINFPDLTHSDSLVQPGIRLADTSRVRIRTDKKNYSRRENINIELLMNTQECPAFLTLSVIDLTQLPFTLPENPDRPGITASTMNTENLPGKTFFERENKIVFEGLVRDPSDSSLVNSRVLSLYITGNHGFYRGQSKNGRFQIEVADFYGKSRLQVLNLNPFQNQEPLLRVVSPWDYLPPAKSIPALPARNDKISQYIDQTSLRRKLSELFQEKNVSSPPIKTTEKSSPPPDKTYLMSDFHSLRDLEEFYREVIFTNHLIRENGTPSYRIMNHDTYEHFMHHPWYLVDGYFTFREEEILRIPFSSIHKLELFAGNFSIKTYFDPVMIQFGIVSVTTNDNYFQNLIEELPNTCEFSGFSMPVKFQSGEETAAGTPDFRPVVFWEPHLKIEKNGSVSVQYRTSDIAGKFLITVRGFTKTGEYITGWTIYEVMP